MLSNNVFQSAEALASTEQAMTQTRDDLFRETWNGWMQRWVLGTAYALQPANARSFPALTWHSARDLLRGGTVVPARDRTQATPDTFGGVCRNISAETVLAAAGKGFFPWCHCGPLKWWTREQRMVLFFSEYHVGKRLRRDMKKSTYTVTFDQAFDRVIAACAGHRSYNRHSLTWITPRIMRLYADLFDQGHAHSFEVWDQDGQLVGGGYGLSVGRVFMTESQFSLASNTSKMGFAVLNHHLAKWGYVLNDGKDFTPTIDAMGFRLIPRAQFDQILDTQGVVGEMGGKVGRWSVETTLAEVADWDPSGKTNAEAQARPARKEKAAKKAA